MRVVTTFTAAGWMPRPESPPVLFARTGTRLSMSITIAGIVLIIESASAPASSHAFT